MTVFISYKHDGDNVQFAKQLAHDLQKLGLTTWVDQQNIQLGDNWSESIYQAIQKAASIVVLVSPDVEDSNWVQKEIVYSQEKGKQIIPALMPAGEESLKTLNLDSIHYVDFRGDYFEALHKLASSLKKD